MPSPKDPEKRMLWQQRLSISKLGKPSPNKGKHQVSWNKGKNWSVEVKEKISSSLVGNTPWNKGKPHSIKTREKIANTKSGGNGWSQHRGGTKEREWKEAVKKRDNYTCQNCGKENLIGYDCHAHHIQPWEQFPELRFIVENGLTLCGSCHDSIEVRKPIGWRKSA